MDKLKTLREIEWEYCKRDYDGSLRQEAIKHIKLLESEKTNEVRKIQFDYAQEWIGHFFNITEEDLQ